MLALLSLGATIGGIYIAWATLRRTGPRVKARVYWVWGYRVEGAGFSFDCAVELENVGSAATTIRAGQLILSDELCTEFPRSFKNSGYLPPPVRGRRIHSVVVPNQPAVDMRFLIETGPSDTLRLEPAELRSMSLRHAGGLSGTRELEKLEPQEENTIHLVSYLVFEYGEQRTVCPVGCTIYGWRWPRTSVPLWAKKPYDPHLR